jgi:hypothetical protein
VSHILTWSANTGIEASTMCEAACSTLIALKAKHCNQQKIAVTCAVLSHLPNLDFFNL